MLFGILMLASTGQANIEVPPTSPSLAQLSAATGSSGTCAGQVVGASATVVLSWLSLGSPSALTHRIKVYKSRGPEVRLLLATLTPDLLTYTHTVLNFVENGANNRFTSDWTFWVELERIADGGVVTSLSKTWSRSYGTCSGTVGPGTEPRFS